MTKIIEYVQLDAKDGKPSNVFPARHGGVDPVEIKQVLRQHNVRNGDYDYTVYIGATDADISDSPGVLYAYTEDDAAALTEELRQQAKDRATQARWEFETGGITLPDGTEVATGLDDQNRISSVITHAENAGIETVDFKSESGWINISVADLAQVAVAVSLHVQSSFTKERQCHEEIDALTDICEIARYMPAFNRD